MNISFDNTYAQLPGRFFAKQEPAPDRAFGVFPRRGLHHHPTDPPHPGTWDS